MSLRELYQEMILEHSKHPRQFGELRDAHCKQHGHNVLCGDDIYIYANLNSEKTVIDTLQFTGNGCAICMASCSMMCDFLNGKSIESVDKLFELFHQLILTGNSNSESELGKLSVFSGVSAFPIRVKCATLPWHTLMAALHQPSNCVSTENEEI